MYDACFWLREASPGLEALQTSRVRDHIWARSKQAGKRDNPWFESPTRIRWLSTDWNRFQACVLDCAESMEIVARKGSWYSYEDLRSVGLKHHSHNFYSIFLTNTDGFYNPWWAPISFYEWNTFFKYVTVNLVFLINFILLYSFTVEMELLDFV